MKTQKFILNIEKPCSEDWTNMTQNNIGKFCDKCDKNVVDFTNMSDTQIIHYFKKSTGICGRMQENQLNREMVAIPEIPNRTLIYKFLVSIFLFGFTDKAFSKNLTKTTNCISKNSNTNIEINTENKIENDTNKSRISGRVIPPQRNNPLKYIPIQLTGTELKTYTDSSGYFSMIIPKNLLKDTLEFFISHPYYETVYFQKTRVNLIEFQEIRLSEKKYVVVAEPPRIYIAGGISIEPMQAENFEIKPNFFKRKYHKIKNLFRKKHIDSD